MSLAQKYLRVLITALIVIAAIGVDRISKAIVRSAIQPSQQIKLLDPYITLTRVENTGAFLSLGHALPPVVKAVVLIAAPLMMLTMTLIFLFTRTDLSSGTAAGIGLVAGGGIGNVYDRVVHGSVTDFLHVDFVLFETGVFNLADVFIMAGAVVMLMGFRRTGSGDRPEAGA